MPPAISATTVDSGEVARFGAIAAEWWDPRGKFRPLHLINPTRVRFIRDALFQQFGRSTVAADPLQGLRVLDIGCGGGLVAEPLARLGAGVTGLDASSDTIGVARHHAGQSGLEIAYGVGTAEELLEAGAQFDAVLALEIVEHVADPELFLKVCADLVRPGGILILSTLNRTLKSLLLGKIAAEYVLRWLPRGTHDWQRFATPAEISARLQQNGLRVTGVSGVTYSPFTDEWMLSRDLDVNYLLSAVKPDGSGK